MTDLPSYELVQRFMHETGFPIADPDDEMVFPEAKFMKLASRLIQHGADQELEACCEWLGDGRRENLSKVLALRAARRPKPQSLKELALAALKRQSTRSVPSFVATQDCDTIRHALEQLND